ncbi:hypothetical protein MJO29_008761 [Puccinia striiformis f. sp. tritici]|nr:hypothetical protein MJO29_008761 [Puccinia striiformis f. sp. tritici]
MKPVIHAKVPRALAAGKITIPVRGRPKPSEDNTTLGQRAYQPDLVGQSSRSHQLHFVSQFAIGMQLLGVCGVVSLLVASAFTNQICSPPVPELGRRHQKHNASFTNVYIMRQGLDYSRGALQIHNPDGSVAFLFDKVIRDLKKGITSTVVMNQFSQNLLKLDARGDICRHKTYYLEPDLIGLAHHWYYMTPRGWKADRYFFSFVAPSGEEFSYVYKRHFLDKGGKVYRRNKGQKDLLVAKFEDQVRWEPWLTPRTVGTPTFTLSCTADAPVVELVALMGLVLTRVHDCGL